MLSVTYSQMVQKSNTHQKSKYDKIVTTEELD